MAKRRSFPAASSRGVRLNDGAGIPYEGRDCLRSDISSRMISTSVVSVLSFNTVDFELACSSSANCSAFWDSPLSMVSSTTEVNEFDTSPSPGSSRSRSSEIVMCLYGDSRTSTEQERNDGEPGNRERTDAGIGPVLQAYPTAVTKQHQVQRASWAEC